MDRIVERYHQVAEQCDAVVVVGSDYTDVGAPAEFAFNARVAANLGAPVLLVLNGQRHGSRQLRTTAAMAQAELAANHAHAVRGGRQPRRSRGDRPDARRRCAARAYPRFALPERAAAQRTVRGRPDGGLRRHASCSGDEALLAREVARTSWSPR